MMKLFTSSIIWAGVCILTAGYALAEDGLDINSALEKANKFYEQRGNPENLKAAVEVYENILRHIPQVEASGAGGRAKALTALSRCCFKLATYHAMSDKT
ncbi:MAG: hypothetical protein HZA01_10290 [Nitrospinae bacterium]|nr:hypothetical protein [Nitrospinota bacterium]